MKKGYLIIIAIILIAAAALVCFKLGYISGKKSSESTVNQYKKIIDSFFPPLKNFMGKVTEVKDNALSVETTIQNPYVLSTERKASILKVTITDKTEISKSEIKNAKLVTTQLKLSDIKVGDQVNVQTEEVIKDQTEVKATSIQLSIMPGIGPAPSTPNLPPATPPAPPTSTPNLPPTAPPAL